MDESDYVRNPLKRSAILLIEKDDKYCILWSTLASLYKCESSLLNQVSKYRHYFDEIKLVGFNFSSGYKYSIVHKFEKLNTLSINTFE